MNTEEFIDPVSEPLISDRRNHFITNDSILTLAQPIAEPEGQLYRSLSRLDELRSAGQTTLLDNHATNHEIREFFALHSATPVEGQEYNVLSVLWNNTGHWSKWFAIVTNANNYKLIYNSRTAMNFDIGGRHQLFPPSSINTLNGTHCTLVFHTNTEKKQFLTMLALKFSNWKYEIKDFVIANSSN